MTVFHDSKENLCLVGLWIVERRSALSTLSCFSRVPPPPIEYHQYSVLKGRVYKVSLCAKNAMSPFFFYPQPLSPDLEGSNPLFCCYYDGRLRKFAVTGLHWLQQRCSPSLLSFSRQWLEAPESVAATIGGSFDIAQSTTLLHSSPSLVNDHNPLCYNPPPTVWLHMPSLFCLFVPSHKPG